MLVFGTLPGLFIGIAISLLLLIYRASHPHIAVLGKVPGTTGQYGDLERHPDNQQLPGIVILRVESGLFFANADAVRQRVRAHAAQGGTRVVVLDAETAPTIDVTAVMLAELTQSLEREGVRLLVTRQTPGPRRGPPRGNRHDTRRHLPDGPGRRPSCPATPRHHQPRRTGRRPPRSLTMACWTRLPPDGYGCSASMLPPGSGPAKEGRRWVFS